MSYGGRYTTGLLSRNFGGINRDASIVNIGNNQAYSIVNWDIGQRGTIKRRSGWTRLTTVGRLSNPIAVAFFGYPDTEGVYHYAAIAYNLSGDLVMYEASDPAGPWTECGGGIIWTEDDPAKYVGIRWKGKLYIVNGADAPVVAQYGANCQTLKAASLLSRPTRLSGLITNLNTNIGTTPNGYGVSAVTPRGETEIITFTGNINTGGTAYYYNFSDIGTAPSNIDGVSSYVTLSWSPVVGAQRYGIYILNPGVSRVGYSGLTGYIKIDEVPYGINTWQDPGVTGLPFGVKLETKINGSYNTPTAWEKIGGYPDGGCVLARGRDERLILWKKNVVYGSCVEDPLNWWSPGNAMVFTVSGEGDTTIVNGSTLSDYLMLFSKTQCWVFTGSSPSDISINKVLPVGCAGPHALVQAGTDTYLLSQFGPTSFKRIMAGADVSAAHGWADKVKPIMFDETNTDLWTRAWAYNDLKNSRIVWTLPKAGQTTNGMAVVYQYDTDSFTTYDSFGFTHVETVNYTHYGLDENSSNGVCRIGYGNTDNGSAISAEYKTGWFDYGTWEMTKRMTWVDVIASRTGGDYTFEMAWDWDYGQYTATPVVCTQTTTDGDPIDTTSAMSTEHRIYTDGVGNAVQLIFTTSAGDQEIEILGWRPDQRSKGLRKL